MDNFGIKTEENLFDSDIFSIYAVRELLSGIQTGYVKKVETGGWDLTKNRSDEFVFNLKTRSSEYEEIVDVIIKDIKDRERVGEMISTEIYIVNPDILTHVNGMNNV